MGFEDKCRRRHGVFAGYAVADRGRYLMQERRRCRLCEMMLGHASAVLRVRIRWWREWSVLEVSAWPLWDLFAALDDCYSRIERIKDRYAGCSGMLIDGVYGMERERKD